MLSTTAARGRAFGISLLEQNELADRILGRAGVDQRSGQQLEALPSASLNSLARANNSGS